MARRGAAAYARAMRITRILAVVTATAAAVVAAAGPAPANYTPPTYPCADYSMTGTVGYTFGPVDSAVCVEVGPYRVYVVNTTWADPTGVTQADQVCAGQYPSDSDPRQLVVCASVVDVVRAAEQVTLYPAIACVWVPTVSETSGMLCGANRVSSELRPRHAGWTDVYLCPLPTPQYSGTGCLPYVFLPWGYPWSG